MQPTAFGAATQGSRRTSGMPWSDGAASSSTFFDHDGPGGKSIAREGDKAMMRAMHTRFPDLHVTLEDMIADSEKVVCRNVWRATDPTSGKKVSFKGIVIWRFANGKIVERWASVEPPHRGCVTASARS